MTAQERGKASSVPTVPYATQLIDLGWFDLSAVGPPPVGWLEWCHRMEKSDLRTYAGWAHVRMIQTI